MKITGLDALTKNLEEAQRAIEAIDGEIGSVSFDPTDPTSIEAAIQEMEEMIDARLGEYTRNPIIGPMISGLKERYREGIVERAAEARSGGAGNE